MQSEDVVDQQVPTDTDCGLPKVIQCIALGISLIIDQDMKRAPGMQHKSELLTCPEVTFFAAVSANE